MGHRTTPSRRAAAAAPPRRALRHAEPSATPNPSLRRSPPPPRGPRPYFVPSPSPPRRPPKRVYSSNRRRRDLKQPASHPPPAARHPFQPPPAFNHFLPHRPSAKIPHNSLLSRRWPLPLHPFPPRLSAAPIPSAPAHARAMPPRPRPLSRLLTQAATPPPHRQSPSWRAPPVWNLRHAHQPRTAAAPSRTPRDTPSQRLLLSYHDLERALERRGLNTARVLLLSAMAAAAGFGLAWPRIKKWGAVEGAEVAVASLETERLQQRAVGMVRDVLADRRTGKQVERLLKEAVVGLFGDEEFMARSVEWTASVLVEALSKEEVLSSGERYLENVVKERRESVEEVLTQVVANVAANEAVQDTVAQVRYCFSGVWRCKGVLEGWC